MLRGEQPGQGRVATLVAVHAPAALVAAVVVWLGFHFGGYHPRVWTWVAIGFVAWAAWDAVHSRLPAPRSPGGLALVAGVALTAWAAWSITWADYSPHLAWDEANRTAMYVAAFAVGSARLASSGALVRAATWMGWAIALVGAVTLVRMRFGHTPLDLFVSGRLDGPLGYANALAAFYVIGALLLLGASLAAERRIRAARVPFERAGYERALLERGVLHERERHVPSPWLDAAISGASLGGATLCTCLALLSQSRGAALAAIAAVALAFVFVADRVALATRLVVVGVLVATASGTLGAPFRELTKLAQATTPDAVLGVAARNSVNAAATTIALLTIAGFVVGAAVALAAGALTLRMGERRMRPGARIAVLVVATVAVGALLAVVRPGGNSPGAWIERQARACARPASVTAQQANTQGSHFGDVGTNRCDFWRVALLEAGRHPVRGIGANNFQGYYVLERRSGEEPKQAHSLPLDVLAGLGLVGAALFALVAGIVAWSALRFARSGTLRDPAFGMAVSAVAYWAMHASIDWLWNMPAVTVPAVVLAGGLVACVSRGQRPLARAAALPIALGAVAIALASLVPQGLADHWLRQSRGLQAGGDAHLHAALDSARAAGDADRTWAEPVLQQADLLTLLHQPRPAAAAARQAIAREPRNWSVRLQAARALAPVAPLEAQRELQAAHRLNPMLR